MEIIEERNYYLQFLSKLERKINENIFMESLKDVIKVDNKYYKKEILKDTMINIIKEYKEKDIIYNNYKSIQVITLGTPEIILRLGIEAVRNKVSMLIHIDDFCLGQNMLIIEIIKSILKEQKASISINLKNLTSNNELIENSIKFDKNICIGDSNRYNFLCSKISDLVFYPYGIFELYADDELFNELKEKIYEYTIANGYEMEIYYNDSINTPEEIISLMDEDGYGFCAVLFSKNEKVINYFKNKINAQYVVINENPFKYIKFELNF